MNSASDQPAPRVSVLLPVFNADRYVADAVTSILGQTFGDFELLIMDDGSNDRSPEILAEFAARDARIRLRRRANDGYLTALNELLASARGDYIARMDSDDMALPERLERQVAFLDANPSVLVAGSWIRMIDEDGDVLCDQMLPEDHEAIEQRLLHGAGGIFHPATMIRRKEMQAVGGYRPDTLGAEDQDLWLRLSEQGRLANLPNVLLKYRIHPGNYSFQHHALMRERLGIVIQDAYRRRGLPLPDDVLAQSPQPTSDWDRRREWAWGAVHSGHFRTARKHARAVLRGRITSRAAWTLLAYAYLGRHADRLRAILGRRPQ